MGHWIWLALQIRFPAEEILQTDVRCIAAIPTCAWDALKAISDLGCWAGLGWSPLGAGMCRVGGQVPRGFVECFRGFETSADARRVRKRPLATWLPPRAGSNVTGTLNVNVWALSRWGYWVVCRAVVAGRCRQWTACLQFPLPLNLQKKQSRPSSKPVAGGESSNVVLGSPFTGLTIVMIGQAFHLLGQELDRLRKLAKQAAFAPRLPGLHSQTASP